MKVWDKGFDTNTLIEQFTIGDDRDLDILLAPYDVLGTLAHVKMLQSVGLLNENEGQMLVKELKEIFYATVQGGFTLDEKTEDIHSHVEFMLIKKLGISGKKVHTGRSRNDQIILDIKLYTRAKLQQLVKLTNELFSKMIEKSEEYKGCLMPGYTHFQLAMPSSFGLWLGAFAESLSDDLLLVQSAYKIANQNPLGSAAGYGSSFPLNRTLTTELLGFDDLTYNSIYAQMGRGKVEKTTMFALSSIAATLSKMATDICIFMNQNFGFLSFPDELTTGSSIMPHKKNPDVFELIRAKCNKIQSQPFQIGMLIGNLPSGYHRDFQLLKESYLPAFDELMTCMTMSLLMLENMNVKENILADKRYMHLFSVEEINRKVIQGVPFRDAYKMVGKEIQNGTFDPIQELHHTHEGSIGNLNNAEIKKKMDLVMSGFNFQKTDEAIQKLLND